MKTFKSHRVDIAAALLAILLINVVATAQTKPAANLTTPTEAMITYTRAAMAAEWPAVEAALIGSDDRRANIQHLMRRNKIQVDRLRAYDAHFGGDKATDSYELRPEIEKKLRETPVTIDGETATMTVENGDAENDIPPLQVTFKKVDGSWKLDLDSYAQFMPRMSPAELAKANQLLSAYERANKEIIARVQAGTYASREDAELAFDQLVESAGTQPATKEE